jgi:hypothetical protein
MLCLLQLYVDYIEESVNLYDMKIRGLINVAPSVSELNRGLKIGKCTTGYLLDGSVMCRDACLSDLCHAVPEDFLFSYFVEGVVEGRIDVDQLAKFKKFMKDSWNNFASFVKESHSRCDGDATAPRISYSLPKKPTVKKSQSKSKRNKIFTAFLKNMEGGYKLDGKTQPSKLPGVRPATTDELGSSFMKLFDKGGIDCVRFDKKVLRDLYDSEELPEDGACSVFMQAAVKQVTKEKEDKAKAVSEQQKKKRREECEAINLQRQKEGKSMLEIRENSDGYDSIDTPTSVKASSGSDEESDDDDTEEAEEEEDEPKLAAVGRSTRNSDKAGKAGKTSYVITGTPNAGSKRAPINSAGKPPGKRPRNGGRNGGKPKK